MLLSGYLALLLVAASHPSGYQIHHVHRECSWHSQSRLCFHAHVHCDVGAAASSHSVLAYKLGYCPGRSGGALLLSAPPLRFTCPSRTTLFARPRAAASSQENSCYSIQSGIHRVMALPTRATSSLLLSAASLDTHATRSVLADAGPPLLTRPTSFVSAPRCQVRAGVCSQYRSPCLVHVPSSTLGDTPRCRCRCARGAGWDGTLHANDSSIMFR
jgi:hypothetical protein